MDHIHAGSLRQPHEPSGFLRVFLVCSWQRVQPPSLRESSSAVVYVMGWLRVACHFHWQSADQIFLGVVRNTRDLRGPRLQPKSSRGC